MDDLTTDMVRARALAFHRATSARANPSEDASTRRIAYWNEGFMLTTALEQEWDKNSQHHAPPVYLYLEDKVTHCLYWYNGVTAKYISVEKFTGIKKYTSLTRTEREQRQAGSKDIGFRVLIEGLEVQGY